jgi:hypothetical protein
MKLRWELKPNLLDCILEARIVPAPITNLGVIALTTSGLSLVTPFPGASNSASGSLGSSSGGTQTTAASVSGAAMPTSFYITGKNGISTFAPGNFTGNPSVGGAAGGAAAGPGGTIQVGSGADDASAFGSPNTTASSRNAPGDNGTTAPTLASIGTVSASSGSSVFPMSSQEGSPATPTAPVPAQRPSGVVIPGSPSGTTGNSANPMNPQAGAMPFTSGLTGRLVPTLPSGLGVTTSLSGMGSN